MHPHRFPHAYSILTAWISAALLALASAAAALANGTGTSYP